MNRPIIYIIPTPIGNLNDISNRALQTLNECDIIAAEDTRTSTVLLKKYNINKKIVSYHKFNEIEQSNLLLNDIEHNGLKLALISDAGTPCISDPGYHLINIANNRGIEIVSLPGPCAFISSISASGFDLSGGFTFHGFLSKKNNELKTQLIKLKDNDNISIVYESPKRIIDTLHAIKSIDENAIIFISKEISKIHEYHKRFCISDVSEFLNDNLLIDKGEYVLSINWNKLGDNNKNNAVVNDISLEALIYDKMIIKGMSVKDTVKSLVALGYNKNAVYKLCIKK